MEAFDRETERVISGCLSASSCTLYIFARLLHNYMLILGATGECVCVCVVMIMSWLLVKRFMCVCVCAECWVFVLFEVIHDGLIKKKR